MCRILQVEVTRDVVLQEMSAARPSYTTRVLLGVDEVGLSSYSCPLCCKMSIFFKISNNFNKYRFFDDQFLHLVLLYAYHTSDL